MNKWTVLAVVMIVVFMSVLDGSIVIIALPEMMENFGAVADYVRLVVELYAVAYAVATLTGSWLRERFGIKRTFTGGILLFTVASYLCGRAWSIESMIAFRILQGLGAGVMHPAGLTLISESFRPEERGRAFGIFGIVIVFAPTIGPLLGGYFVDYINWRYIFFVNVPIGAFNIALALKVLRELKDRSPVSFDIAGFASLSIAISCLLLGLSQGQRAGWESTSIVSLLSIALFCFFFFIISGLRKKNSIIKMSIFNNFHYSTVTLINLMRSIALFARLFLAPVFFQVEAGFSATTTGLIVSVGAVVAGITTPITGFMVDRVGPKVFFFAGFILMGISNIAYATIDVDSSYFKIIFPMVLFGLGAGMLNSPIISTSMNVVNREDIGLASTIMTIVLQVGAALGVAAFGTIVTIRSSIHADAVAGFQDGFLYLGIFSFLALIPALGLLSMKSYKNNQV